MTKDLMGYDRLMQRAQRGIVREAFERVARDGGLPGQHHFYVTFRTQAPGVEIADYLIKQYPEEITIVLEHQFWDLEVSDRHFEVTLKFKDVPQHVVVPFTALTRFFDPSVNFGLPLQPAIGEEDEEVSAEIFAAPQRARPHAADDDDDDDDTPPGGGKGEVVSLEKFRKK